ncbi:MAG: hypothetical protein ACKOW9_06065 [Candidatus Paceibacterota bacterium]
MVLRPSHPTETENRPEISEAEAPQANLDVAIQEAQKILISGKEFVERVNNLEIQLTREISQEIKEKLANLAVGTQKSIEEWQTISNALAVSNEKLPDGIDTLSLEDKHILNTTYDNRSKTQQQENIQLMEPAMRQAIAVVNSGMRGAEYPYWAFGSTAFVAEVGSKTGKMPVDVDFAAAIQDFPVVYQNFKELQEKGKVEDLKVVEMSNMQGKKNDCFEIKGHVKITENDSREFSVFFQNINPDGKKNGRVNIGIEQTSANIYDIEREEVPLASCETNTLMYARSLLYEVGLFNYRTYADSKSRFPELSAKMLQRWSNLMVMNDYDNAKVMTDLKKAITKENSKDLLPTLEMVQKINKEFVDKNLNGAGLTQAVCSESNIQERCEERSVDIITMEIKVQMELASNIAGEIELIVADPDRKPEEKLRLIEQADSKITEMYCAYSSRLQSINKNTPNDRIMYAAMRSMENNFLFEIVLHFARLKSELIK